MERSLRAMLSAAMISDAREHMELLRAALRADAETVEASRLAILESLEILSDAEARVPPAGLRNDARRR